MEKLLNNLEKIHTTELGKERIKINLTLNINNVVEYCKNKIKKSKITKQGKNYYCEIDNIIITINSFSFTIITAHKKEEKKWNIKK